MSRHVALRGDSAGSILPRPGRSPAGVFVQGYGQVAKASVSWMGAKAWPRGLKY